MAIWEDRIVELVRRAPADIAPNPENFRLHPDAQRRTMEAALEEVGKVSPLIENLRSEAQGWPAGSTPVLLDGHLRRDLAIERGEESLPVIVVDLDQRLERIALQTLDPIGAQAEVDHELLAALLEMAPPESADLSALLEGLVGTGEKQTQGGAGSLSERFGVPPFSVLDARQGYWQERKKAWLSLGIRSELGRGGGRQVDHERDDSEGKTQRGSGAEARGGASPGGSPRPAMSLGKNGKTRRGDGKGRVLNG